jgi:hypothetical protein
MKFRQWAFYLILSLILVVCVQNSFSLVPSRQAKFITFSNVNSTTMTINVTRGNGTAAIWLVRQGANPNVSALGDDTDPTGWSANTTFGSGTNIGGSNSYLVQNGTGTSVTVTGLTANTTYYVMVLEYNVDGSNYDINNSTATLNPRSKTTLQQSLGLPSGLGTSCITGTTATINWTTDGTNAVGYYLDVRVASGAILPAYDLLDIGLPSTKTFLVSGLSNSTNYEYRLRPYDAQGRVGAATVWVGFTTQTTDPTPVISGTTPVCPSSFSVSATWTTSGWSGAPGVANWTMLSYPSGAGYTFGSLTTSDGVANNIDVNLPGTYVVQAEIVCGEYAASNTYQVVVTDPAAIINNGDDYACGLTYETATGETSCGTGTWSWSGAGTVSFYPDNTADEVTVTNNTYGAGTLYWTVIDGSVTSSDFILLSFLPDVTATYNGIATFDVCGLTYGPLQGNDPNEYFATGSWYQQGGTGTANFNNPIAYNSNVSVNQYGTYTFRWELQNNCDSDFEDIYVTFWEEPSTADAGSDFSWCLGDGDALLGGNTPSVGTGTWTSSPSASFQNPNFPTTTVYPSFSGDYGIYTFYWTIGNGPVCSTSQDWVVATFYNTPTISANAGSDTYICATTTYQLGGNDPVTYPGIWTQIAGPEIATFSNPTLYNSLVTVEEICSECCSDQYTFRWSIINGTCTSYDDVALTFLPPTPSATIYNTNLSVCGALTYDLEAEGVWCGEGTWTSTPTGAIFEDVNWHNVTATIPAFSGDYVEYTFNWTVSGLCGTNNDDITVTFYNPPTTANAGADTYYCGTLTGAMAGNTPTVGSGSWTKFAGPSGSVSFDNPSNPTTTFTVPTFGEYTFAWTISNGTCDPSVDYVTLTYYQLYTANAGTDQNVCGLSYQLSGNNVPSPSTVSWSLVSGPGSATFSNTAIHNPVVNTSTYGTYTFQYSITNGPCSVSDDQVEISFFEPIDVVNNGNPNPYACINQAYTGLNLGTPTCGSGSWTVVSQPTGGSVSFGSTTIANTTLTFTGATGNYNLRYTHNCGPCSDFVDIPFNVTTAVFIPPSTTISGPHLPVAGTNNVQYSVPNFSNDLTYNWSYTCENGGTTPTITNNGNHFIYINYPLDACDGTLSVTMTDLCGNITIIDKDIFVQLYPVITGATLNQNNSYIDVTFNNPGVYTNNVAPLQPVNTSDFQLIFQQNGGTATNVTVTSMTKTDGSALTGGETTVRFNLNVTGTPNGCETIEIKPFANQVYSGIGSLAMPATQTTGVKNLFNKQEPTLDASNLNTTNVYAVQATLNWTNGNGQKRLVVMKQGSAPTGPTDYITYTANTAFGSGATTGAGSFVVFNGTGNSVTVTNLNPNTTYFFGVYEYNNACNVSPNYQNSAISSFTTAKNATKLVITSHPTKILSGVAFNITIQAQDASNNPAYTTCNETITVSVTGSGTLSGTTSATFPISATSININGIVYTNNSGECNVTFTVDDAGCGIDLTNHNFVVNVAPGIPPGQTSTITGSVTSTTITINWTNPSSPGDGRVVFVRQGAVTSLSSIIDGNNYDAVSTSSPVNFSSLSGSPTDTRPFFRTSSGTSVQLTNLTPSTTYNFRVVEYKRIACGSDALYRFRLTNFTSFNPRNLQTSSSKLGFNGVEIAYFDGKSYQLSVDLNWEAISENGIMGYEVYRMQDIEDAQELFVGNIGVKATAGNSNRYNLLDNQNLKIGESYLYRLVGVDINGQKIDLAETYVTVTDLPSNVFNLSIGEITPNPVKDIVRFDISTSQQLPVLIQVFNADGKVVYSEERTVNGTSNVEFKLNNAAAGSYYIMVTGGDEVSVGSFIYQP